MRVLLVGAGGVGTAITRIAARRPFFDTMVVADHDPARAEAAVAALGEDGGRFLAERVDARDEAAVAALLERHGCDVLLNATDPRFVMPLFRAARTMAPPTWTWRCHCPDRTPNGRTRSAG